LIVIRDISEQKKLEKLRDDLIHAMVHDLRNPLSSIVLSLDLLKSQLFSVLTKEQLIMLETGENSTRRILDLVSSILDISRLENGQMPLKRENVLLQKMAAEVIQTQLLIAQKKRILLQKDIPDNLHPAMVDAELMRRVLQNLLDNAIKFSPDGGVVRIRAEYNPDGREIIVSVRDTGSGIPDDMKSRLFEKFAPGNTKGSGSGLGLAFCRLVLEAHKGRIWVDEKAETGTTISLSIPLS
jgi:signal transduction histidine kinase